MKKYFVGKSSKISKMRGAEAIGRERAMQGDKAFKVAMLAARLGKHERFAIGVDKSHCTEQPIYVGLRALMARSSSALGDL